MTSSIYKGFSQNLEINLPAPKKEGVVSLEKVLNERQSIRDYSQEQLKLEEVSQVLWAAYGSNKYAKLTAPSAGGCFPLAIYLVVADVEKLKVGFYKYNYRKHSLKLINSRDLRADLFRASLNQPWVKNALASVVICADYEITASHYGERASRYVNIEVGHAGQNIYLQAAALGLGTVAVGAFYDEEVKEVLGVKEDPLYIMPLGKLKRAPLDLHKEVGVRNRRKRCHIT